MQNNFKLNYLLLFAIVGICWNLTPLCRFPKIFFLPRPGGMIPIHLNKSLVSAENQCGPARKSTYCMFLTLMRRLQSNTFFSLRCHFFDLSDIDISDSVEAVLASFTVRFSLGVCEMSGLCNQRSAVGLVEAPHTRRVYVLVQWLSFSSLQCLGSSPSHSSATYLTRWLICFLFSFSMYPLF